MCPDIAVLGGGRYMAACVEVRVRGRMAVLKPWKLYLHDFCTIRIIVEFLARIQDVEKKRKS